MVYDNNDNNLLSDALKRLYNDQKFNNSINVND